MHGAFVSLFLAQTQGSPYGLLVAALVAAAESPGSRSATAGSRTGAPKPGSSQPAAAASQALAPLNRADVGQGPAAAAPLHLRQVQPVALSPACARPPGSEG